MRWIDALEEAQPGATLAWIVPPGGGPDDLPTARVEDVDHAARRRDPERRAATLKRRRLLRALASQALEADPGRVVVDQPPTGGPRVVAPVPLHAALAARDGWTLVTVSQRTVGADVERVEPGAHRPLDLLHPSLAASLYSADDLAFVQAWAAAEAHLKRTGAGIATLGSVRIESGRTWSEDDPRAASAVAFRVRGDVVFACATPAMEGE